MSTSQLHCPPTLVVARHARAEFVESYFSDEGGSLTAAGRAQARHLAESLADRRIAAVWTSDVSRAVQTAEIAAARLGVGVTACKSLREVFIGDLIGHAFDLRRIHEVCDRWHDGELDARYPGGESGGEVVARHRAQFEEIADQHNGETVLVVGHQTALDLVLHALSGVRVGALDNAAAVELTRDGSAWSALPHPGPLPTQA